MDFKAKKTIKWYEQFDNTNLIIKNIIHMLKRTLLFISLGSGMLIGAQVINETNAAGKTSGKVGINTDIPTRTLTIKNTTANNGKPVLRLAGTPKYSENVNSAMDADLGGNPAATVNYDDYRPLVVDKVGDVYQGLPLNNVSIITLTIDKVNGDWIEEFDTGIDYSKYTVAIMSATFKMPAPASGGIVMLRGGAGTPNVSNSTGTSSSTIAPAVVTIQKAKHTNNWAIFADYPNIGPYEFSSGNTSLGTIVNGSWIITLLISKKNSSNINELYFNQGGSNMGNGPGNTTYTTKLQNILKKLE